MLKSLKVRFIAVLVFIILSIATVATVQYNLSIKLHSLFESQLALKELQLQFLRMQAAQTKYFSTHKQKYIDDVEVYANTIDIYFGIVDEYLENFMYPQEIQESLEIYIDTFDTISSQTEPNELLFNVLQFHAQKVSNYINSEQTLLTPLISTEIENIKLIQNAMLIIMAIVSIFLLIMTFKPFIRSITIFKQFFSSYKSTKDRLDLEQLYFDEVKEMGHFVNHMLENQEKIQKVKDEFLSNMSHELRTPLNAIGGFSGVLLRKFPNESEIINPIIDSSAHLLQLVSDILDISKIQSGKFKIVAESFRLDQELESFSRRFTPLVDAKNIAFTFHYEGEEKLTLLGDWFRIAQILNNFMSNAIKFTPENGTIQLHISYKNTLFYAGVKDSGIGIKKESLQKILQPFEQSDDDTSKKYGGTGLGLSIAKTLTEMMGGIFKVESEFGKGSTFSVSIPLKYIQTTTHEQEASALENEAQEEISIKAHILIAEDNKTNQLLLSMLLDDLGISFDVANDGQEAVDLFQEKKYDIILMDENMPNLSGTEAMLALHEKFDNVPPIIAVTANAMKGDKERLLELGMDDFLSKPIDNDLLIQVIKRNL